MVDFEALYAQYFRDVYRYALTLCRREAQAEEITQETFFKALQKIDTFRGECKVYVWLCEIARNTYFSSVKKQSRLVPEDQLPESADSEEPEQMVAALETSREVQQALHRLEEPYKEVLLLRIYGEMPFARIGELFGRTESWARVTYHRGRMKVKELL